MSDDAQLLRQFVGERSEAAFQELVQRHLGLVYHAATRQLGADQHLAEDVAQAVFVLLAEKSPELLQHPSLAGWLHTATRFKVARAVRGERRRQVREQAALAMSEIEREHEAGETTVDGERLRPILDEVLQELGERDREAVLLRFFEQRGFDEIAARLRVTDAAARKVVERALEKLRARLARRGLASSSAALAVALGTQGALAAPAGLATAIAGTVLASGLPVATATVGSIVFMSTKTLAGIAAVVAILGGVATWEWQVKRDAADRLESVEREIAGSQRQLQADRQRARASATAKKTEAPRPAPAARPASATPAATGRTMKERMAAGTAFLKAHPEMRAALAAYYRKTLRYQYADLIASLGLSEAQADRFLDVIANGSFHMMGDLLLGLGEEMADPKEYTRQLKEALGDAGYAQYRDVQHTATARSLTSDLVRSLYFTPTPLLPAQIAQFRSVIQQALDDRSLGPRYDSVWEHMPMPVFDRILANANGVLTPAQLEALTSLEQQAIFHQAQSAAMTAYAQK